MIGAILALALAQDSWPMYGQNDRRTGQSPNRGPAWPNKKWTYDAAGGLAINMQPVVTASGVYFGTWGVMRREKGETPDLWEKFDGRYYGLSLDGKELFSLVPGRTPVGYVRPGRKKQPRDEGWCGAGNDFLVSYYNGTIEGTACVDPKDGTHYVGRGDGRLYAIANGEVKWSFRTFNPEDPEDPDGGGEIIGGPAIRDGILYFGTVGMPWPAKARDPAYETSAIYAVDRAGKLVWRYPSKTARLSNWVYTPPAFSPDGKTIYVATFGGDMVAPGRLMALDRSGALRWEVELRNPARPLKPAIYAQHLAVGLDGRVYGAGCQIQFGGSSPAAFAVENGKILWVAEPQGYPSKHGQMCGGIALFEKGGAVRQVHVSTTHLRIMNGDGGALFALDPATGQTLAEFSSGVGGMTAPVVDSAGTVFVGIRGKHPFGRTPAVPGRMFSVAWEGRYRLVWELEVDGQLDWAAPAIGEKGTLYFGSTAPVDILLQARFFGRDEDPKATPKFYGVSE